MSGPFVTEHAPPLGVAEDLGGGVRVVTAPNGGPMTFTGTRSYLVGTRGLALIDPGPDLDAHRAALLGAVAPGQRITHILVTHAHLDHAPLATRLGAELGVPTHAFGRATEGRSAVMAGLAATGDVGGGEGLDLDFVPDIALSDGAEVVGEGWRLRALHTPGHLSSHLCFALPGAQGATLFSGDHVMGWASTLVSPPDRDVGQFMASLDVVDRPEFTRFLPGHGPEVRNPGEVVAHLRTHRQGREAQIRAMLGEGPATAAELTARIYRDVPKALHGAAARNVLAHLIDLAERLVVAPQGGAITAAARYALRGADGP